MAFSLFRDSASAVKHFEIRLEQNVIVFRGTPDEAASAVLKGMVVLCLAEPLSVKKFSVRLQGYSRLGNIDRGQQPITARPKLLREESAFFKKEVVFVQPQVKNKSETLPAGNYEHPFEMAIPGDTPESVEGLFDSWVIYRLKATLERGLLSPNLYARQHLRVVRTLDGSALELSHEMSVENVWAGKVEYSISTPRKAFVFGTSIPITMKFVPLKKGLKPGDIRVILCELREFRHQGRSFKDRAEVASLTFRPEEELQYLNDEGQEGWLIQQRIQLPSALGACVQDVETMGIKIRHKLHFTVQLINPDGHSSEIRALLPVQLYLSPHFMVGREAVSQRPATADLANPALEHVAPPLYGDHQLDQLWSEIDTDGYMTPATVVSGATTPLLAQSRNASTENLASLDAMYQGVPGAVPAQMLQSRLTDLPDPGPSRRRPVGPAYPSPPSGLRRGVSEDDGSAEQGTRSPEDGSNPVSRQTSGSGEWRAESPLNVPEHIDYDTETLSKVPSYHTAMLAPTAAPLSGDLPNYEAATGNTFRPSPLGPNSAGASPPITSSSARSWIARRVS